MWYTNPNMTARTIQQKLQQLATSAKAKASAWFFKTGKGQYGYGDKFRGVTVPEQRKVAKQFRDLPLSECKKLLHSSWHEDRLTAVFILVYQFEHGDARQQQKIVDLYLANTHRINNWDIVDSSAGYILVHQPLSLFKRLAKSANLWERRIAMIGCSSALRVGNPKPTVVIATMLLTDQEDLMHKAVGWMLREMGKRCGVNELRGFLKQHAATMPRTALRYAIEHMTAVEKRRWLALGKASA
jgi:3-methyladenine DNA glycosylase AlkD